MVGNVSGRPLTRAGAKVGDTILVSGTLGDASGALSILNKTSFDAHEKFLIERYERPLARVNLSISLLGIANSAIDISDGLLADAGHIATASDVGIDLLASSIPISSSLSSVYDEKKALEFALSGGDDYELVYTVPKESLVEAYSIAAKMGIKLTKIGMVTNGSHVRCLSGKNQDIMFKPKGYKHF
jgi:thiamine-monophosphate kinase